jgi:hypothetical protein
MIPPQQLRLLSETWLGDLKPSQLLRKMRGLSKKHGDIMLHEMWLSRLPTPIPSILAPSKGLLMNSVAEIADNAMEYWWPSPSIAPVIASSPNSRIDALENEIRRLREQLARTSIPHNRTPFGLRGRSTLL